MDENKVLSFMDEVQKTKDEQNEENAYQNSNTYKMNIIDREREIGKDACVKHVMCDLYKNSLPVSDEFKRGRNRALDDDMVEFMSTKVNMDEACKNSPVCKKLMEKVNDIVNEYYSERVDHPEDYTPEDMVFRMNDDTNKKLDLVSKELELDDLSDVISDNVKQTATAEITRAKEQKEENKKIEQELANDMTITSESAIEEELELRGYKDKRDYQPSLFGGIMIGKLNTVQALTESGHFEPEFIYNDADLTLTESATGIREASVEETAFLESVKEYTKLSILKALKIEDYPVDKVKQMANDYASVGF